MKNNVTPEEWWRGLLTGTGQDLPIRQARQLFALLPGQSRCKFCNAPFDGNWAPVARVLGRGPSRLTNQFCHRCQVMATSHLGGTETDLTLLFADVRGSTQLGEQMNPAEFSQLISRFFSASSQVLLKSHAWVDRLVGDQVIGMYIPYFVGSQPELSAIRAAKALLHVTGQDQPGGAWIEIGIGIHSGTAFIGTVGSKDSATDITVLGDVPNITARLAAAALPGEILISETASRKANYPASIEKRTLDLKGKSLPLTVYVLNASASA